MSGFEHFDGEGHAYLNVGNNHSTSLMSLLVAEDIQPGSAPSYQVCKTVYSFHPLGAKLAEAPIDLAQSQCRKITVPGCPEEPLVEAFWKEWNATGGLGADRLIKNVVTMSRVYGISSIVAVARGEDPAEPLDVDKIYSQDLYYSVFDPLNTSGSLVLDQDPLSLDFQKPRFISVGGQQYHPSRSAIVLNEQPVYIEWTSSAFGYVGRSVYQRALYPLKSYISSMITDNSVTEKAGLIVAKLASPGSFIDKIGLAFAGFKRQMIKGAKTGNVLQIGTDESIESLDLKNLKDAAEFARNNILKNIASASKTPAAIINEETLAEGFGEGTEDAKRIATFIDGFRKEMSSIYAWFDNIVMRRAWSPEFYKAFQNTHKEYKKKSYEVAFNEWKNAFCAAWPNLLEEPDSERIKVDDTIAKSAIAAFEVLVPTLDPENKAAAVMWLADILNERKLMFSTPLVFDEQAIAEYEPPNPEFGEEKEPKPIVESSHE
jgi:hypothetical protein